MFSFSIQRGIVSQTSRTLAESNLVQAIFKQRNLNIFKQKLGRCMKIFTYDVSLVVIN